MDFNYFMPVKMVSGRDCVLKNKSLFREMGKRCLIVTGGKSAAASGALADVTSALKEFNIGYRVYDEITQNPLLSTCKKGGVAAKGYGADFLIGIGGGSPLDATKAIAVFAANDIPEMDIYNLDWKNKPLPFALVGTTAGTGSEVTAFSILTIDETGRKKSVKHPDCFAEVAFMDPKYTASLPYNFTVSTALDSLSHAIEGYFASTANDISDIFALKAIPVIYEALNKVAPECSPEEIPYEIREALYYGSIYAGLTLCRCGTGYCHPLGYFLSEEYGIPHGAACAVYLPDYIERGARFLPEKAQELSKAAGITLDELSGFIERVNNIKLPKLTDSQIGDITERLKNAGNLAISPGGLSADEMTQLLKTIYNS